MTERLGEIIETNSFFFVAESFTLNRPPALGELVKAQADIEGAEAWTYAIVTYGETAAIDPGRQTVRRSKANAYDKAVYTQHPELELLLRTVFSAVLVGQKTGGNVTQRLPAYPPPMHFSVHTCDPFEVGQFVRKLAYLRTLASAETPTPVEQVLAANLRWTYQVLDEDRDWLDSAALEVAALLQQDVEKLLGVLYAVDPEA